MVVLSLLPLNLCNVCKTYTFIAFEYLSLPIEITVDGKSGAKLGLTIN